MANVSEMTKEAIRLGKVISLVFDMDDPASISAKIRIENIGLASEDFLREKLAEEITRKVLQGYEFEDRRNQLMDSIEADLSWEELDVDIKQFVTPENLIMVKTSQNVLYANFLVNL